MAYSLFHTVSFVIVIAVRSAEPVWREGLVRI